jgi:hypothetical protein
MEMLNSQLCKTCARPKDSCEFCNISLCSKCDKDLRLQNYITCTLCVTCYLELSQDEVDFYYGRETEIDKTSEYEKDQEVDY